MSFLERLGKMAIFMATLSERRRYEAGHEDGWIDVMNTGF